MIPFPGAKEASMKEASLSTPENFFGEGIAERYDESHSEMFASSIVGPAVDFLAGVAGKGAALELGIGTGRIALPLARRGVHVHGIELSEAMIQQLRAKPGATTSRSPSEISRRPRSRAPSRLPTSSSIRLTT
jgi:SAM-dependent methyltransferase